MTISKDLFLALLSMDAYNRGYEQGIEGLENEGALLGNAKIIRQSDVDPGSPGVDAGFYAVAYETTKDIGTTKTGGVIPKGTTLIAA
jgi:hypothetical protein